MMARDFLHRAPFTYELTNAGAEIRRMEQRIAQLEAAAAEPEREPTPGEGFTVCEDKAENRIRFEFDEKPPREVCRLMRGEGWRWSPTVGAWQRQLNNTSRASAEHLAQRVPRLL